MLHLATNQTLKIMEQLTGVIIVCLVAIIPVLICIYIMRAIFSIDKFLQYQRSQTYFMAKLARQQGVSEPEIEALLSYCGLKETMKTEK